MIKTFVGMAYFCFVMIVNVVAVFLGKLFFEVAHSVKRLEQYCEQYC